MIQSTLAVMPATIAPPSPRNPTFSSSPFLPELDPRKSNQGFSNHPPRPPRPPSGVSTTGRDFGKKIELIWSCQLWWSSEQFPRGRVSVVYPHTLGVPSCLLYFLKVFFFLLSVFPRSSPPLPPQIWSAGSGSKWGCVRRIKFAYYLLTRH